jgi:hypothetical protein
LWFWLHFTNFCDYFWSERCLYGACGQCRQNVKGEKAKMSLAKFSSFYSLPPDHQILKKFGSTPHNSRVLWGVDTTFLNFQCSRAEIKWNPKVAREVFAVSPFSHHYLCCLFLSFFFFLSWLFLKFSMCSLIFYEWNFFKHIQIFIRHISIILNICIWIFIRNITSSGTFVWTQSSVLSFPITSRIYSNIHSTNVTQAEYIRIFILPLKKINRNALMQNTEK